jgi:hypothetical protein
MLKAVRPDCSNYFNSKNDVGKNSSCCAAMGCQVLVLPGVTDTYTLLMNTWNTLQESYQQRVYKITLVTVKRRIEQAVNPKPAVVLSMNAVRVNNAILLDHLTSEVALNEPEIRCTDPNILNRQQWHT